MKHVKIMSLPDCDKLIYTNGEIARQIGTMMLVDDENFVFTKSYPILSGGKETADGYVETATEVQHCPIVCRVGEKISPERFAKFVKKAMREEVPSTAYELFNQLIDNGGKMVLPILASTQETIRKYNIELEFYDFDNVSHCVSTDTGDFFFEVYYEKGDHDDVFRQLSGQLMDYMEILEHDDLHCQIVFNTLNYDYMDVVKRLNNMKIETMGGEMYNPR